MLPNSNTKCWFTYIPPGTHWANYIEILDTFARCVIDSDEYGEVKHLMLW